jgi:uncharacterized coiled-coil DUF342 family protein
MKARKNEEHRLCRQIVHLNKAIEEKDLPPKLEEKIHKRIERCCEQLEGLRRGR